MVAIRVEKAQIVTDIAYVRAIFATMIQDQVSFTFDIEGRGLKAEVAQISGIAVSSKQGDYYFPLNHYECIRDPWSGARETYDQDMAVFEYERLRGVAVAYRRFPKKPKAPKYATVEERTKDLRRWSRNLPEREFMELFIPLFRQPKNVLKGAHNSPFDWRLIMTLARRLGVCRFFWPQGMADSLLCAYALSLHLSQFHGGLDLDTVAKRILRKTKHEADLDAWFIDQHILRINKKGGRSGVNTMKGLLWCAPVELVAKYAIQDALLARELIRDLLPKVYRDEGCRRLYERELALAETTITMESAPKFIHVSYLRETYRVGLIKLEELRQDVFTKGACAPFNIDSPKALPAMLRSKGFALPFSAATQRKLEAEEEVDKVEYSTDASVLDQFKGDPFIDAILRYRKLKKRVGTDMAGVLKFLRPSRFPDLGMIFPNLSQTTARTGRYGSSKPNGQNQTRDDENDEWSADFSTRRGHLCAPTPVMVCRVCHGDCLGANCQEPCEACGGRGTWRKPCGGCEGHGALQSDEGPVPCHFCCGSGEQRRLVLSADLKQIEPRWVAHLTKDKALIQVYLDDRDVYAEIGRYAFGIGSDLEDKAWKKAFPDERQAAKSLVLAILYGAGSRKVAVMVTEALIESIEGRILTLRRKLRAGDLTTKGVQELREGIRDLKIKKRDFKFTLDDAYRVIARMEERFPGIFAFRQWLQTKYEQNGFIRNPFGRMLYLANADKTYTLLNAIVQSSAADMLKQATLDCYRALRAAGIDCLLIFTIHDEILFDVAAEALEAAMPIIQHEMTKFELRVPLAVDFSVTSTNWSDLHSVEKGEVPWLALATAA